MKRISLLVKDNLKSPPLPLLQPRASLRAKKRNSGYFVQWTTVGQCSRGDQCGMKRDPEKRRVSKRKVQGVATVQLSATEFLGKSDSERKNTFRKRERCDTLRL